MALTYPGARWTPLGAQTEDRLDDHDIICVHTMVGYLTSTDPFFRTYNGAGYDGTESHFGVGGKWGPDLGGDLDGAVWQWQDLDYRADANYEGNHHVISIETADNAARPIQPWTDAQADSLVTLIAWLCRRYDIPPTLVPDTRSARRGLAYHAQGAAEHTVGEWWSTSPTKDCPTAARILQYKTIVIPRVQRALAGEDDMSAAELATLSAKLDKIYGLLSRGDDPVPAGGNTHPDNLRTIRQQIAALSAAVRAGNADIEAAVAKVAPASGVDPAVLRAALAEALATLTAHTTLGVEPPA